MNTPMHEELVSRLVSEFGYPQWGAERVAANLAACAPGVREAFVLWWTTRQMPAIEVEGFTLESLVRDHAMNPIAAFLTLDALVREPGRIKASLARGHDDIDPGKAAQ